MSVGLDDVFGPVTLVKHARTSRRGRAGSPMRHTITLDFEGCDVRRVLEYAVADLVIKIQSGIRKHPSQYEHLSSLSFTVLDLLRGPVGSALVVTPEVGMAAIRAEIAAGRMTTEQAIARLSE